MLGNLEYEIDIYQKHVMEIWLGSLNLWNQESLKLWNQETNDLWNRNQATLKPKSKKLNNQETNTLFQLRESPAPLNILNPTPRTPFQVSESGFLHVSNLLVDDRTTFCALHWERCSQISPEYWSNITRTYSSAVDQKVVENVSELFWKWIMNLMAWPHVIENLLALN